MVRNEDTVEVRRVAESVRYVRHRWAYSPRFVAILSTTGGDLWDQVTIIIS